jgi:hypothetical protein
MATSDDVATVLKSLNEGIQRLEERLDEGIQRLDAGQQRLEIYTKEIMGRLLSPTEIAEVEHKVAQIEQPSQPLTAGR